MVLLTLLGLLLVSCDAIVNQCVQVPAPYNQQLSLSLPQLYQGMFILTNLLAFVVGHSPSRMRAAMPAFIHCRLCRGLVGSAVIL